MRELAADFNVPLTECHICRRWKAYYFIFIFSLCVNCKNSIEQNNKIYEAGTEESWIPMSRDNSLCVGGFVKMPRNICIPFTLQAKQMNELWPLHSSMIQYDTFYKNTYHTCSSKHTFTQCTLIFKHIIFSHKSELPYSIFQSLFKACIYDALT